MADSPAPSRRSVLAVGLGGAGALALAGCADEAEPRPTGPQASAGPAGLAPDVGVATTALSEIEAVRVAVSATVRRFPAVRPQVGGLVALHQAHEATLVEAVPQRARPSAGPAPYVVPRDRDKALAKLAARERRLHESLGGLALKAQSGQFARLLASMGAAVDQRLATWSA